MPTARWRGAVIAAADRCVMIEGNYYFPPAAVRRDHLRASATQTVCSWKGTAHYYDVIVDGQVNRDAAWYYADPKPAAAEIKDHVAFWHGITVEP